MAIETEIDKIKIVLCALWDKQNYPEAQEIIDKFKEEIDNIRKGN